MPTEWACSLISSFKDVAVTLTVKIGSPYFHKAFVKIDDLLNWHTREKITWGDPGDFAPEKQKKSPRKSKESPWKLA